MNRIANPFLVYGYISPEYFCDRQEETQKLISALKNGRHITLMSPRRMGKTGLIKNVFYHIQQQEVEAACFYMDIFSSAKRPFYRSTEKMSLHPISAQYYFPFAHDWMKQGGKQLDEPLFMQIYERYEGHTWYVQYILNRLYEQSNPLIDEKTVETCLKDIILSEVDSYQQLYGMLTENQSSLLRAIARERIVTSINSGAFISKYKLKGSSSINAALKVLINKEYVYKSDKGYQVYDRFMELWLQILPYNNI